MTQRLKQSKQRQKAETWGQPLDRTAWAVMMVLSLAIAMMLILGSQALPQVKSFSWEKKSVEAEDIAFILTFTQPMVTESVEENLVIDPPLSGKVSWAGRKMAYTVNAPAPYGEEFQLSLPTAQALNGQSGFEPFETSFKTRDRIFAYIGAEGDEMGRLILFNLTKKEKAILTAADQTVLDFEPYPERDRILYSAVDSDVSSNQIANAQIYTVTTGLDETEPPPAWQFWKKQQPVEAGVVERVLDNEKFQNLKFDLAPNGETIVVQRVSNDQPSNFGPWVLKPGEAPRKLKTEPGGDFKIAPDSVSLLLQQGRGTAVIDLEPTEETVESESLLLDFLPEYGLTLDIADDGASAAFVNFNQNDPQNRFTQSLYWVSNRGEEKLLLQTDGAILSAQFDENGDLLYCLVNRLIRGDSSGAAPAEEPASDNPTAPDFTETDLTETELTETELTETSDLSDEVAISEDGSIVGESPVDLSAENFSFSPYLSAIDVETGEATKLLEMPPQPEIAVSLSPDGLAILFDEVLVSNAQTSGTDSEYEGPTHRLWLLPLFNTLDNRVNRDPVALPPTELDISGRHPIWLP